MTVYLVGAGPGDPGLFTLRGAELLRQCDVVVHDRLIGRELLDMAPAHAERVDVGKARGSAPVSQDEINAILVERGRAGLRVVRLKGGDPFVFARGGEEALALAAAGVPFACVPGVSSALAAPAAAGIPLTLRSEVLSFTVVSGHHAAATAESANWEAIAATGGTIVILMGSHAGHAGHDRPGRHPGAIDDRYWVAGRGRLPRPTGCHPAAATLSAVSTSNNSILATETEGKSGEMPALCRNGKWP